MSEPTAKQPRGEETVKRVLDAALRSVIEAGVHAVSVQDISARSSVSIGSIYHHFGARDGVVFALYRRCLERMLEAITASVVHHRSARVGVHALVASYLRWVERHPDEARVIYGVAEADLSKARRADLAALGRDVVAPLAAWLAPHVTSGKLAPMPVGLFEVVLIGPAAEASRRILAGEAGYGFDEAVAVLPEVAWRSVRRTTKSPDPR